MEGQKRRGPYNRYYRSPVKIPRQTLHNQRLNAAENEVIVAPVAERIEADEVDNPSELGTIGPAEIQEFHHGEERQDFETESENEQDTADDANFNADAEMKNKPIDDNLLKQPLFENCPMTLGEFLKNLLHIYLSNAWTKKSLTDTLDFISRTFPGDSSAPRTKYMLEVLLNSFGNTEAVKHVTDEKTGSYFYEFPVDSILINLLENKYIKLEESSPGVDLTKEPEVLKDITDGSEYRRLCSEYTDKVSLLWGIDGVPLFEDGNQQLWPIIAYIIELPLHLRYQVPLILGVHVGEHKPDMNGYIRALVDRIKGINKKGGFIWTDPNTGLVRATKVVAPLLCADAPAKADALHIHHHNGECGCPVCEEPGISIAVGAGHARAYPPPSINNIVYRTEKRMLEQGLEAVTKNEKHVKGVIGPTILALMPAFDISTSCITDYMHIFIGLIKALANFWFSSQYSDCEFSLRKDFATINDLIIKIKPTDFITRLPRAFNIKSSWKASEYRHLILFYCLPLLKEFFKKKIFQHLLLLCKSTFILLQEEITLNEIKLSEHLLLLFVQGMEEIYPGSSLTYNLHQLFHLPLCTRRWGPPWCYSAFFFENFYGVLLKSIHGSRLVQEQLANNFHYFMAQIVIKNIMCTIENPIEYGCQGAPLKMELIPLFIHVIKELYPEFLESGYKIYSRFARRNKNKKKEVFTSAKYKRSNHTFRRINNFVSFSTKNNENEIMYGAIQFFVVNDLTSEILAVVKEYDVIPNNFFCHEETKIKVTHIKPVKETWNFVAVNPITEFKKKMIYVQIKDSHFLCDTPNDIEYNL